MYVERPAAVGYRVVEARAVAVVLRQDIVTDQTAGLALRVVASEVGDTVLSDDISAAVGILQPVEVTEIQPQQLVANLLLLPQVVEVGRVLNPPLAGLDAARTSVQLVALGQADRPRRRAERTVLVGLFGVVADGSLPPIRQPLIVSLSGVSGANGSLYCHFASRPSR